MIGIPQPNAFLRPIEVSADAGEGLSAFRLIFGQRRMLLAAAVLVACTGMPVAQTDSPSIPNAPSQGQPGAQSPFAGSVASEPVAGVLRISLQDAIDRGLKQNLGVLLSNADIQSARGQRWEQLSALLPHVTAGPSINVSQINLAELGITVSCAGT